MIKKELNTLSQIKVIFEIFDSQPDSEKGRGIMRKPHTPLMEEINHRTPYLQDQAGTTTINALSEEKSQKLKITESNRSCENNKDEESFQSDEDTEGMMTFINENDSSAGKIREFNTNTKKERDHIQSSSVRNTLPTQEALSPSFATPQIKKRSRQTLLDYNNP